LSDHVLDTAVRDLPVLARLHDNPNLGLSVNLAPEQLVDPAFPERVRRLLVETATVPQRLTLEVTEERLILDEAGHARAAIEALALVGVRFALDDFGVGFSGLAALYQLPISIVKIDRMFVSQGDEASETFVGGIVSLAHTLGLTTVAEGVETDQQLDAVRTLGCERIQGYLTGRPARLLDPHTVPQQRQPVLVSRKATERVAVIDP
jgi:EAL domain-containing protein (putative c-di-GMP-specific phosphodiesterase class I)